MKKKPLIEEILPLQREYDYNLVKINTYIEREKKKNNNSREINNK